MLTNLEERFDVIKESLSAHPINNKKNRQKYLGYLDELLLEYGCLKEQLFEEMNVRYEKLYVKNTDIDFSKFDDKKSRYNDIFNVLNERNTPYEKIGLDRCLFKLTHFYQENFEDLNLNIMAIVDCFRKVGIILTSKDFNFNPYVVEYMSCFFEKFKGSNELKELFDKLYWKCPNIIFYIALNFKHLYYKNEKIFLSYYQCEAKNIMRSSSYDKLLSDYRELIKRQVIKDDNIGVIISKLLSKEYNLKDYSKQMKDTYYGSFTSDKVDFDNVIKLYNSLYEYSGYIENKYIIEKFKKMYAEKDKYKNIYKNTLKEISKIESEIVKLNRKYNFCKKYFNNIDKLEDILLELNQKLELVRVKYDELDNNKFLDKISLLGDSTTYLDILELTNSYYLNVRKIIKDEFNNISEIEINNKIRDLVCFLEFSNLNILNNIKIKEEVDIALVISDRYKLLNFNISKDSISNNVIGLMDNIVKLKRIKIIEESNITYDELVFLCMVNELRS